MRGRTWPTSVTQPITQPSHASTHNSMQQGGDPTRSFLGGASTRMQARRLDHNSCPEQPPGPRGAEDVEGKVREAAATSTEEGLRPGSPHHSQTPPATQGPTGRTRPHRAINQPRGCVCQGVHGGRVPLPRSLTADGIRLLRAFNRARKPSTEVGRLGGVYETLKPPQFLGESHGGGGLRK